MEKECDTIRQREIMYVDEQHDAVELSADWKILMGPPTLKGLKKQELWEHEHYNYL